MAVKVHITIRVDRETKADIDHFYTNQALMKFLGISNKNELWRRVCKVGADELKKVHQP